MKSIPTLIGMVKCVFTLVVMLLATAGGSKTEAFQTEAGKSQPEVAVQVFGKMWP